MANKIPNNEEEANDPPEPTKRSNRMSIRELVEKLLPSMINLLAALINLIANRRL